MKFNKFGTRFIIRATVNGQHVFGVPAHGKVDFSYRGFERNRATGLRAGKGDPITRFGACEFNLQAALNTYQSICDRAEEVYPEISELTLICID